MTTLEAVRTVLLADATVAAQLATRIYPLTMPDAVTKPAAVLSVISMVPQQTLNDNYSLAYNRVEVDVYGLTYASARAAWAAIEAVLRPLKNPAGLTCLLESERDLYENETQLFRISCDVAVYRQQ